MIETCFLIGRNDEMGGPMFVWKEVCPGPYDHSDPRVKAHLHDRTPIIPTPTNQDGHRHLIQIVFSLN